MGVVGEVWISDVSPRDGFQIERNLIPLESKVETINALSRAGMPVVEVTSFVSARMVPQMVDAELVMKSIERLPGTKYSVLVPNIKGAERALETGPNQINLLVSASDSHNLANIRRTTFETLDSFKDIPGLTYGTEVSLCGGIATAFGCPFEGAVAHSRLFNVVERYLELGINAISLADTTGMANPAQVNTTVEAVRKRWPDVEIHLHFHNTRSMGIANVYAGFLSGVRHFDASLGGIGGCPFAPGAMGNIATEDTVHMFQEMGIQTGVDLDALISAAKGLQVMLGRELPGQVMKAGKASVLFPLPNDVLKPANEAS